jgi:hypothetical protein
MPTFLSDPPQVVYLILGGLLVITGAIAAQRQDRRTMIPFLGSFLLMLAVFLTDRLVESPREEAVRRTHMLAMAADAKPPSIPNPEAFGEHLADKVTIYTSATESKTLTRDELKKHPMWHLLRVAEAHVAVWSFSRDDARQIDENTIEIGFLGKGTVGDKEIPVYLRATYAKQPDGSFKLSELRVFEPLDHSKPFAIPGFP